MFARYLLLLAALLLAVAGCSGNKATGKYSNQDKPKPAETK
jgi:hypothetical protein